MVIFVTFQISKLPKKLATLALLSILRKTKAFFDCNTLDYIERLLFVSYARLLSLTVEVGISLSVAADLLPSADKT